MYYRHSAEAADAFLQVWTHIKGYTNPLWNLVGKTLIKMQTHQATIYSAGGTSVEIPAKVPPHSYTCW